MWTKLKYQCPGQPTDGTIVILKHDSVTHTVQYPQNVMPWEVLVISHMQPRPIFHVIITYVDTLNKPLKGYTFKLGNDVQKVV